MSPHGTLPGRSAAARRGAATRRRILTTRGVGGRCAREGCAAPRQIGSYCRACWAAYMRDYRAGQRPDGAGARKFSRETTPEAAMPEPSAKTATALNEPVNAREAASPAGALRFIEEAPRPARPALSAAEYLLWLTQETRVALRLAEEALGGGRLVALPPLDARLMLPLPADLPPLVRRFLEVQIRLAHDNLDAVRRIAACVGGVGAAFDAGLSGGAQPS